MNNLPLPPLPEGMHPSVTEKWQAYARKAQAMALEAAAKVAEDGFINNLVPSRHIPDAIRALQVKS